MFERNYNERNFEICLLNSEIEFRKSFLIIQGLTKKCIKYSIPLNKSNFIHLVFHTNPSPVTPYQGVHWYKTETFVRRALD